MLGPDRAATATGGIEGSWPRQQRNLTTAGCNPGAISDCADVDGILSGVLPMKIASYCREQENQLYFAAVFEIKKEIPACHLTATRAYPELCDRDH